MQVSGQACECGVFAGVGASTFTDCFHKLRMFSAGVLYHGNRLSVFVIICMVYTV